jgi:hypothetical protein
MSRTPVATLAICTFTLAWIAGAAVLADHVRPLHWALQAIYYPLAGSLWVLPVWWMMLWGAHRR